MRKRDWAFVAACFAGALLFGVWSVQMGIAFHRSRLGMTDLSSSHRQAGHGASTEGSAADDLEPQSGRPQ
jgi:hypothetical protein